MNIPKRASVHQRSRSGLMRGVSAGAVATSLHGENKQKTNKHEVTRRGNLRCCMFLR